MIICSPKMRQQVQLVLEILFLSIWIRPMRGVGEPSEISLRTRTGGVNASGEPIRIYTSLALDCCSKFSSYGRSMRQNYELLIDWISEHRGGLRLNSSTPQVRPLEIVIYNDYSDSERVSEIYGNLVHNQGHRLFLSTYSSGLTKYVAEIVNTTNAVLIAGGAASTSVFKDRPNVFGTLTPSTRYLVGPFEAAGKVVKTMMYVYEAALLTTSMCEVVPSLSSQYNVSIDENNSHQLPPTPAREVIRNVLLPIKDNPPDLIIGCVYKAACRMFLEEIAAMEIEFKSAMFSTCGADDFDIVGRAAEYAVALTPWLPSFPLTSEVTGRYNPDFTSLYESKYAETPNYQGVSAQMSLMAYVEAIEKTGSTDPVIVAEAVRNTNMKTIYGTVSFDENGQCSNPMKGVQCSFDPLTKKSVLSIVAPEDVAESSLVYPMPSWIDRKCLDKDVSSPYGVDETGTCVRCPSGHISEWNGTIAKRQCVPCGIGNQTDFVYDAATEQTSAVCVPCPVGHQNSVAGTEKCAKCEAGRFASRQGQISCDYCHLGYAAAETGSSECGICANGTFASERGMSECVECPAGRYSDARALAECKLCPGNMVTFTWSDSLGEWLISVGAKDVARCGCKAGTQMGSQGQCVACGDGLDCIGNGQVNILPGYASDGGLSTFKCRPDPKQCPGGAAGVCASGRRNTSVGCSRCEEGKTASGDGTCGDCGPWGYLLATFAGILMLCALLVIYIFNSSGDSFSTSPVLMQIGITIGQMIVMIQNLGIVGLISIDWPLNLQELFDVLQVFNFDIGMLRPECLTSVGAVGTYVTRLLLVFVTIGLVLLMHCASVVLFHKRAFQQRHFALVGSCGSVVIIFFISVVTTVLTPFQCDGNPNDVFTLRGYPEVRCWEGGDHQTMIIIGGFAVLIPLAFLAITSFVIYNLPARMAHGDTTYLRTWAFMLVRFRPGMYWVSPLLVFRNALFACASVFTRALIQIIWLEVVLFLSVVACAYWVPWRVWQGNVSDSCITSMMLFVVVLTAFFVDDSELSSLTDVMMGVLLFLVIGVPVGIVLLASKFLYTGPIRYHFFLCHHKLAAGASARLFKQILSRKTNRKVFIDSDDLKNLSQLFDTVSHDTETLVVLHTADVLKRPWCMGEITVAYKKQVPTVIVMFPQTVLPTTEFIDNYETFVQGINVLTDYSISLKDVKDALSSLSNKHIINLPEHLNKKAMELACKHLMVKGSRKASAQGEIIDISGNETAAGSSKSLGVSESVSQSKKFSACGTRSSWSGRDSDGGGDTDQEGTVAIVADSTNWEAVSTALVLHEFMIVHLYQFQDKLPFVLRHEDVLKPSVTDMVLICTAGMFHKADVMAWLVSAAQYNMTSLPILADVAFRVPHGPSLKAGVDHTLEVSRPLGEIHQLLVDIFLEIGIVFQCSDAAGTEETLKVKGKEVAARLCMAGRNKLKLDSTKTEDTTSKTTQMNDGTNSRSMPLSGSLFENPGKTFPPALVEDVLFELVDQDDIGEDPKGFTPRGVPEEFSSRYRQLQPGLTNYS